MKIRKKLSNANQRATERARLAGVASETIDETRIIAKKNGNRLQSVNKGFRRSEKIDRGRGRNDWFLVSFWYQVLKLIFCF